jgi:hypothetical protein
LFLNTKYSELFLLKELLSRNGNVEIYSDFAHQKFPLKCGGAFVVEPSL